MSALDQYDNVLLALCMWREARGEGLEGMRAVGHVILNRVKAGWGDLVHVITNKNQFSSISVLGDGQTVAWPARGPDFAKLVDEAEELLAESQYDTTQGALYYENPKIATSPWFVKNIRMNPTEHPVTANIGKHVFYA